MWRNATKNGKKEPQKQTLSLNRPSTCQKKTPAITVSRINSWKTGKRIKTTKTGEYEAHQTQKLLAREHKENDKKEAQAVKTLPLSVADHKYMKSGQRERDRVHAAAETARRKVPVYSPDSYYTLVRPARRNKPHAVHELGHKDFLNFKSLSNQIIKGRVKDEDGEVVGWHKIKWFHHVKEDLKVAQRAADVHEMHERKPPAVL